jgi:acetyl esterase/lipase
MPNAQLDAVIRDVKAVFTGWNAQTTLEQMRRDWDNVFADVKPTVGAKTEKVNAGGAKAEWITAPGAAADRVIVYVHGGGYVLGSINSHRDMCERLSRAAKARVLSVDYRLAPEHPFPAAVDDAANAYRWVLKQGIKPGRVAIAGDSAGGGLTVATLLALKNAKDPMPACAVPISPWVDMEATGESMTTLDALDPMVHKPGILAMAQTYLGGADVRNPLAAPLHGDLKGLPPLFVTVGGHETLLDDARRIAAKAKAAGVPVELKVYEGQIHVFQIFAARMDEGEKGIQDIGAFVLKHTA